VKRAIHYPSYWFPLIVIILERICDKFISLLPLKLNLTAKEHSQEAGTGEVRIFCCDSLGEVVAQLWGGVSQLEKLVWACPVHQLLQLVSRHVSKEPVIHLRPPLWSSIQSTSCERYNLDWYSSSSEFSGDSMRLFGGGLFCVWVGILIEGVHCVPSFGFWSDSCWIFRNRLCCAFLAFWFGLLYLNML